ncbi:MAG: BatD family protein [Sulfurimonas sp.]|nr:BatD family protein [Sulfurimonas sp.]
MNLRYFLDKKKSAKVLDNKFTQPSFKGFWLKGEPRQEVQEDGLFSITKIIYTLSPQRVGQLNISSANIKIARRENTRNYLGGFFPEIKWKTIYSNALDISSKPLPNDVYLVGDFSIEASVNKTQLNPNEVVNLTITLSGKGNLEDVKSFKPYLDGVSIFDEKILIAKDVLTQKITFVGDSSFTIPAFELKVFNTQTQEVKTITTKPIPIKINNAKKKEELLIKREEKVMSVPVIETKTKKLDTFYLIGAVLFGFFLGIISMLLRPFLTFKRKKKVNLKDTKMLLVKLLPFKENSEVKEIIDILENNLYADEKTKLDKKALKEILKRYEIN